MIAVQPNTRISIPFTNWEFELSAQNKKVMAVAVAALGFFALQMGLSITSALLISGIFTVLTHFSPREDNDWFNLNFNHKKIGFLAAFLILRPLIIQIICSIFGVPLPMVAQEGVANLFFESPFEIGMLASVVAPFCEEVLFRGFLLERLQDLGLSQGLSNITQAVVFGAIHLNQAIQEGLIIPVFCLLSYMGLAFTWFKEQEHSLLAPIAVHSANNMGACFYFLLSDPVGK